ncbi:MAG: SMC-Scp complex subunit ScpB [Candidatus Pacebacteria bacterium]|jgi:segregation and condensation protein B|nr:SMC-Scp complex subunit ScpB [Parcubacteria group bacterium]MDP6249622.1 SMC-Scp complex subunit ScpB [Candidatus Paceibacterota bacterium]MDP7159290.1 SMC-Scp complex subunit ScpB [Candidatus Paceibacterota bacterium]MDP7466042.1 SMC-Scp complex subunit ScpB [Candidatus Paceibacterota bacterium]HJO89552.1 SMC-Scp complex subunit ScpB [Candidatus Paceibacterota bacterium]|tara:strand:- start:21 stop:551 length:531 start_codon:yes stop_codon:yes gene_type:complete
MKLDTKIEALLFFKGEGVKIKELVKLLKTDKEDVENALLELKEKLSDRGIGLIRKEDEVMLGTVSEMSDLIEEIRKEELTKDLGKAGAETLSIVLYKGPITRAEIDYIRGVNSTFILRNLLIRGLVEKVPNPKDQRSFLYKPTLELLSYLGISGIEELPEFDTVQSEIKTFIQEEN